MTFEVVLLSNYFYRLIQSETRGHGELTALGLMAFFMTCEFLNRASYLNLAIWFFYMFIYTKEKYQQKLRSILILMGLSFALDIYWFKLIRF